MPYANVETLLEFVKNNTPNINGETTMACVVRAIKEAPTADVVEVKHGQNLSKNLDEFKCSECGFQCCQAYVYGMGDVWYEDTNFDYCPGCGAKMDGGEK